MSSFILEGDSGQVEQPVISSAVSCRRLARGEEGMGVPARQRAREEGEG